MSEVPYDPSGRVQQAAHPGYAQLKSRQQTMLQGPARDGTRVITIAAILGLLMGIPGTLGSIATFAAADVMLETAGLQAEYVEANDTRRGRVPSGLRQSQEIMGEAGAIIARGIMWVAGFAVAYFGAMTFGAALLFRRSNMGRVLTLICGIIAGLYGVLGFLGLGFGIFIGIMGGRVDVCGIVSSAFSTGILLWYAMCAITISRNYADNFE